MATKRVRVEVVFFGEMKNGDEGDRQADAISDEIIRALERSDLAKYGVYEQSYSVEDWSEEDE